VLRHLGTPSVALVVDETQTNGDRVRVGGAGGRERAVGFRGRGPEDHEQVIDGQDGVAVADVANRQGRPALGAGPGVGQTAPRRVRETWAVLNAR